MSKHQSSIRFIVAGFAILAILALSVAAESFWSGNMFDSIGAFFGEPATLSNALGGQNSSDEALAAGDVAVGSNPSAVRVNQPTNKIYVANKGSNNVTVIDGTNNSTATVAAGTTPVAVAINPGIGTNKIYVANQGSNNVTVIDALNNSTATVVAGTQPNAVAVNQATNKIYVANQGSNNVTVIDGTNNSTATVTTGSFSFPVAVAVNQTTNKIYVANQGTDNVTVIDGTNNSKATVVAGTQPNAVAVNQLTNKIYVTNILSANVTVINGTDNSTANVAVGTTPWGVAVNEATNKIYVVNRDSNNVTVIDGTNNSKATVAVGTSPQSVAVNPLTNKIYVGNANSQNVTVIDGTNNSTTTVAAGNAPVAVAVNQGTNTIYVANQSSNTVTVIGGTTPTPTPQAANGLVAFQSKRDGNYEIYTSTQPAFGIPTVRNMTNNPAADLTPAWSPDGTQLAFASDRDTGGVKNTELYIMQVNADGSPGAVTRLTTSSQDSVYPTWSTDGKRIAFMRGSIKVDVQFFFNSISQIYIVDVASKAVTLFTNPPSNSTQNITPAWSPDGTKIAFAHKSATSGKFFLETGVVNADNTIGQISFASSSDTNNIMPAWSPDGTKLVFMSDRSDPFSDIWLVNLNGPKDANGFPTAAAFTKVGSGFSEIDGKPVYSPDGTKITWMRVDNGVFTVDLLDIFVINADGSGQQTKAAGNSSAEDSYPSWQAVPGTTPTPTPTPAPASTLSFDGRLRDRVSRADNGVSGDGDPDGTFTLTLPPASIGKFLKTVDLCQKSTPCAPLPADNNVNRYDTIPQPIPPFTLADVKWVVGVDYSLDSSSLLNQSTGSVDGVPVSSQRVFKLFASADANGNAFVQGSPFSVTVTFSDNTTATASTTVSATPLVDLTLANLTGSPNSVSEGQAIEYHMTIKNNGTLVSTGVTLQHLLVNLEGFIGGFKTLPNGSVGSTVCQQVDTSDGTVRTVKCQLGTILPGDTFPVSVFLRFQKGGAAGAGIAEFKVFSEQSDANFNDNAALATVAVGAPPRPSNDDVDVVFRNFFTSGQVCVGTGQRCDSGVLPGNVSGNVTGANIGATRQDNLAPDNPIRKSFPLGEPSHVGNIIGGRSVWYMWQAPARGSVTFSTGPLPGATCDPRLSVCTNLDTLLAVYTILPDGNIFKVAENDDAPGVASGYSTITFNSESTPDAPVVYFIVVDGYKGATGNINLSWNLASSQARQVTSAITGFTPGTTCSSGSDPSAVCLRDADGNFQVTVTGTGFTSDSRVFVKGIRDVRTDFSNTSGSLRLVSHISPSISLTDITKPGAITVRTRIGPAPAASIPDALHPEELSLFEIAQNIGQLNVFELHNFVIPPGQTQEVCIGLAGNKDDDETCITFGNDFSSQNVTVTPTLFAEVARCVIQSSTQTALFECQANIAGSRSNPFAFNPKNPADPKAVVTVKKKQSILPGTAALIGSGAAIPQFLVQGGVTSLIANDGSSLVGNAGGTLVGNAGGTIVSNGGSGLVGNAGGTVISNDGASLISEDGSGIPDFIGGYSTPLNRGSGNVGSVSGQNQPDRPFASNDLSNGAGGQFIGSSSGGTAPTFTISTDPVTGEKVGTITMTFDNTSNPRVTDLQGLVFGVSLNPTVVKLVSSSVTVNEGDGRATVTVNRTGDTTNTVTVSYATSDGTANMRTDYSPVFGSVTFAPGETQKTINIPIVDNGYGPGLGAQRSFNLTIGNTIGGAIQMPNMATINITNNDAADLTVNPLDNANQQFFVRQQYLDLLGREPTAGELSSAAAPITLCGSDQTCVRTKRTDLSYSLFQQYSQASAYVFRLYRASYGNLQPFPNPDTSNLTEAKKWPAYAAFFRDRVSIVDGVNLAASQLALANAFVLRPEFVQRYSALTLPDGPSFVDAVLTTIRNDSGIDVVSQRNALILVFNQAGGLNQGRGAVMYRLAEEAQANPISNGTFINAEYNRAFAATLYFGYLKRDGDIAGVNSWKGQLDAAPLRDASTQKGLVDAFLNMVGYRSRFGLAGATVGGHVFTSDGRGLRNASVSITDSSGVVRLATTSSFGFYSFDNVLTGSTYTIRISSRLFRFAPRALQVTDSISNVDFVGLE